MSEVIEVSFPCRASCPPELFQLNCITVEKGRVFTVLIEKQKTVGLLKEILARKLCYDREDMLQLFLAKTKDNQWLSSRAEDVKKLKGSKRTALISDLTKEERELLATESLADAFLGMDHPATSQIHVLVVVPPQEDKSSPAMIILELMLCRMLTMAPSTVTERKTHFKDNLGSFYGCYRRDETWLRCMLLDVSFPKALVSATHLFRRSNEYLSLELMQISDIDDVRNGLLLFKPLGYAFDHFKISFIRDATDTFRLKLWDESIRGTRLIDTVIEDHEDEMKNEKVLSDEQTAQLVDCISLMEEPYRFDTNMTFGDMDGSALVFAGIERPFYRCLNLQARLARIVALKKGQSDASYDFPDFWSEVSLVDKMDLFQRSILEAQAI